MPQCRHGHQSDAADFCSVCGAEIGAPAAATACPVCATPRGASGPAVCPVCGYNAATGRADIPRPAAARWDVVVTVHPDPDVEPPAAPPVGAPPQTFTLFDAEAVVGRANAGVRVQVPVAHDPGVSRRHAVFVRQPDGGLAVRDLGSANGTRVNGAALVSGVDHPLADGDVVAVGAWSRLTVRRVG